MLNWARQNVKAVVCMGMGAVLLVCALCCYVAEMKEQKPFAVQEVSEGLESETTEKNEGTEAETKEITVEVSGAVAEPGIVILASGSRVYEAVEKVGGLTGSADTRDLNQAALLEDGIKIYIPTREEVKIAEADDAKSPGSAYIGGSTNLMAQSERFSGLLDSGKVNLNSASATELETLNGVGPSTAQKIIEYRENNGDFQSEEDLMKVSGIGEKTFEKLKDSITAP